MARDLFGSIIKAPSGHYYGRYRRKGHDYYTPRMRTKTQVYRCLAEIHAAIVDGTWVPPAKGKQGRKVATSADVTVTEWVWPILDGLEDAGFSPNTARSYQSVWRRHILPIVGDIRLSDLSEGHSEMVKAAMASSYAAKTVRNVMLAFSAVVARAVADKVIPSNPVKVIGSRGETKRAPVTLASDDLERLIDAVPQHLRAAFALASWGCLRYGEIAPLERRDVDLPLVSVTKAVKRACSWPSEVEGGLSRRCSRPARGRRCAVPFGQLRHGRAGVASLPPRRARRPVLIGQGFAESPCGLFGENRFASYAVP